MYALGHIVACTYSVHVVTGSKRTCSCATCAQGGDRNSRPRFQSQKKTSSRARSIPLTGRGPKPRPLRSPAFPEGLRKLTGVAAARVASANRLYRFAADIFTFCSKAGKICIIENPTNSLMWDTRWFRAVVHLGHWNSHHACMYGSARDKKTSLLSTHPLPSMQLLCDGQHSLALAAARMVILGPSPLLPKLSTPRASVLPWPRISVTL